MCEFWKWFARRRGMNGKVTPSHHALSLHAAQVGQFHSENRLRHNEEQLTQLVAGVRDYAIFLLDQHGKVLTWNAGAERIKGYRADEIIGQHFTHFYPKESVTAGWLAHELRVATETGRFKDEGCRIRKDGSRFWANVVMPRMGGCEAASQIRSQEWGGSMTLIAVTGCGMEEDRRLTSTAGFDDHLVKPVSSDALEALFARHVTIP